jgi:hypothetical protein
MAHGVALLRALDWRAQQDLAERRLRLVSNYPCCQSRRSLQYPVVGRTSREALLRCRITISARLSWCGVTQPEWPPRVRLRRFPFPARGDHSWRAGSCGTDCRIRMLISSSPNANIEVDHITVYRGFSGSHRCSSTQPYHARHHSGDRWFVARPMSK